MRRDKLDRAIKTVHWKTPRWFFRRCDQCGDDVKGETMWWYRRYVHSPGYPSTSFRAWTCRKCCPLMSDFFKAHAEYGALDLSPIEKEEEEMKKNKMVWKAGKGGNW